MVGALERAARAWEGFWFVAGPPQALGLFRILLGLYWLVRWLPLGLHVPLFFSGEGMYFPFVDHPERVVDLTSFLGWWTPPMPVWAAWGLYGLTLASLVAWTLGWHTRVSLGIFTAGFVYHYLLFFHMQNTSYDRCLFLILLMLLCSPCGAALSLDARRRGQVPDRVPLWTQRLICVQITILYLGTGLAKLTLPAWSDGDLLYKAMLGQWGTPLSFWVVGLVLPLGWYDLMTVFTKLIEVYTPFLLFSRRTRPFFFVAAGSFHLGIALLLGIWQFLFLPLTYVLFCDPQWIAEKLRGVPRAPASPPPQRSQ